MKEDRQHKQEKHSAYHSAIDGILAVLFVATIIAIINGVI